MITLGLTNREWKLQSWRPFAWYLQRSVETDFAFPACNGPIPAVVPGSAHSALKKAGLIKDWNLGRNSLDCEWVEHRHWEFYTEIAAGEIPKGERVLLEADGLDYSGWICIEDKKPIEFSGALKSHKLDLSEVLGDGKAHRLRIIFDSPPEDQGQIGFTSRTRWFKPRYNFSWDWCPRLVPVGIWDALRLKIGTEAVTMVSHYAKMDDDFDSGAVVFRLRNDSNRALKLNLKLTAPDGSIFRFVKTMPTGYHDISFPVEDPELWWPNGHGSQNLYQAELQCGENLLHQGKIGFKRVHWLASKNAPDSARPLLCEINGKPIFIQGINWTPVNLDYPDAGIERYRKLIRLYADLGTNVLRVWGGAFLERELFYDLCDEAGLMVWQEFPLCSSGCDNCPPESPEFLHELEVIATDYVRRRSGHASLLLWCGGNELQTHKGADGTCFPLTEAHPSLQVLRQVIQNEAPGVRFLPTSPSGPLFARTEESLGKQLHHHVHAPWDSSTSEQEWKEYWDGDDAIFRAEAGVAGASSIEMLKKYAGDLSIWPCSLDNMLWKHSASFWLQPKINAQVESHHDVEFAASEILRISRERQAEFLAYAVRSCKNRFPECTGFMVWMGHDCFPVPSNTSIIDFDLNPKPAYYALRNVFRGEINQKLKEPAQDLLCQAI